MARDGGEPKPLTTADRAQAEAHFLPARAARVTRWVLFTVLIWQLTLRAARIDALDLATGERKTVIRGGHDPTYLDSGFLVYATAERVPAPTLVSGSLRAVRFDPFRAEVDW